MKKNAKQNYGSELKRESLSALHVANCFWDAWKPIKPGISLLSYHRIGAVQKGSVNISIDNFRAQMEWLATYVDVISLDEALTKIAEPTPQAKPMVVLTFDDGTFDWYENALPVLIEFSLPTTWYVATHWIDSQTSFGNDATVLTWEHLKIAQQTGLVHIGSHTHNHTVTSKISASEMEYEVHLSKDLIYNNIGEMPRHFAYPKAMYPPPQIERVIRKNFFSAAGAHGGLNLFEHTDPYRLKRTPITQNDDQDTFATKVVGGLAWEGRLRSTYDLWRYRNVRN